MKETENLESCYVSKVAFMTENNEKDREKVQLCVWFCEKMEQDHHKF